MSIPREGSRDTDKGILVSCAPDWCWVQVGSSRVLVPFNIYAKQADDANTAPTVRQQGKRSHTSGSLILECHGDEAGNGLGVKSGTKESVCQPKTWSKTVRIEGKHAVRHNDEWWMNNRNTIGKLAYMEDVNTYEKPESKVTSNLPSNEEGQAQQDGAPDYGPPRDHGNGVVSDLPADQYQVGQQYARMTARPAPVQPYVPPVRSSPPPQVIPGPANDRLPPPPSGPNVGPIPQTTATPSPTSSYVQDNALYYSGVLGAFRVPNVDGPLGFVQPLPGNNFDVGGETLPEAELDRRWNLYKRTRQATKSDPNAPPQALPQTNSNIRITGRKRTTEDCGIRPYKVNSKLCGVNGGHAHHGIIDFPMRTGTVAETRAGLDHRAPGAPSYDDALTVCVPRNDHSQLHSILNREIERSADNGITKFSTVKALSFTQIDALNEETLSKECKILFKQTLNAQYSNVKGGGLFDFLGGASTLPVRGQLRLPLTDSQMDTLSRAWGFER